MPTQINCLELSVGKDLKQPQWGRMLGREEKNARQRQEGSRNPTGHMCACPVVVLDSSATLEQDPPQTEKETLAVSA